MTQLPVEEFMEQKCAHNLLGILNGERLQFHEIVEELNCSEAHVASLLKEALARDILMRVPTLGANSCYTLADDVNENGRRIIDWQHKNNPRHIDSRDHHTFVGTN